MVQKSSITRESRVLKTLEDTAALAKDLAVQLKHRQIIGLQGDMGSGKTHFVKALAEQLGLDGRSANSPTFAIHQEYRNQEVTLHHIDLFRLESEDEIESSGFWDLFYEENVVIAVEWIDRIDQRQIPEHFSYLRMDWQVVSDGTRQVLLTNFR
jgi:tRNA threonylcarbamoyladenosine biosynthesis protein TsaE